MSSDDAAAIGARVFLLGCSRSGTTVVQRCLAHHPEACSFPETGYFRQLGGNRFWAFLALQGVVRGAAVRRAWARLTKVAPEVPVPERPYGPPLARTRIAVGEFLRTMDADAVRRGRRVWVEKTPRHYRYARIIARHAREALILHVVRDGREVVASIRDRAIAYPDRFAAQADPAYGVREWNRAVRAAWAQRHEAKVRTVLFSDFVAAPEDSLRSLCAWIGLDYSPRMLKESGIGEITRSQEAWKSGAGSPISPPLSKFSKVFDPGQQRWVDRHLDHATYRRLIEHLRGANHAG